MTRRHAGLVVDLLAGHELPVERHQCVGDRLGDEGVLRAAEHPDAVGREAVERVDPALCRLATRQVGQRARVGCRVALHASAEGARDGTLRAEPGAGGKKPGAGDRAGIGDVVLHRHVATGGDARHGQAVRAEFQLRQRLRGEGGGRTCERGEQAGEAAHGNTPLGLSAREPSKKKRPRGSPRTAVACDSPPGQLRA